MWNTAARLPGKRFSWTTARDLYRCFSYSQLKGKYLLPDLIDTHVHLGTDPTGTDNRAHTLSVLEHMLFSGINTVRDMAGDLISPDIYYSALMAGPVFFKAPGTASATIGGVVGKMPYMLTVRTVPICRWPSPQPRARPALSFMPTWPPRWGAASPGKQVNRGCSFGDMPGCRNRSIRPGQSRRKLPFPHAPDAAQKNQ